FVCVHTDVRLADVWTSEDHLEELVISTMLVLGMELRLWDLAASIFTQSHLEWSLITLKVAKGSYGDVSIGTMLAMQV
ncbi:hypothetical protein ACQP3J_27490, partial [Escherichia coli]